MSSLNNISTNTRSMNGLNTVNADNVNTNNLDVDTIIINDSGTAPTMPASDNSQHIATTAFVTSHASSNYVTLNTPQTITATKTFNVLQYIPNISGKYIDLFAGQLRLFSGISGGSAVYLYVPPSGRGIIDFSSTNCDMVGQYNLTSNNMTCSFAPSSANEYTNKNYVDSNFVDLSNTQTITGNKTFNTICPSSTVAPTTASHLTNKNYVDTAISGGTSGFVTTNTTQTITGQKTFSNANTYITGNLITDIINSSATSSNIEIGNNQTSGQIKIGTNTRSSTGAITIGGSIANTTVNAGPILTLNSGGNIIINSSATAGNYSIGSAGSTTGTMSLGTNLTSGIINIGTSSTRTGSTNINTLTTSNAPVNIGSVNSSTQLVTLRGADLRLNKDFTTTTNTIEIGSGNSWSTTNINSLLNIYGSTIFDDNVTNNFTVTNNDKCYFLNGADFNANCFFDGVFTIQQALSADINIGVASHTDSMYFKFGASPSIIGQLQMHYVNALNKLRLSQTVAGKSFALGLGATDYIIMNPSTTYCDIPKMSTGFIDISANTINAKSGFSMALQLNGTNMIQLDSATSKVFMGPTRCSSYLEVVGETQCNNPIELNYNPSSLSAGRLGFQYYSTSTTTPFVGGFRNITFTSTGLDYFTLPVGVWLCELYSGWAQQSNNRGVSLSATSATMDNSRACYSTQQNTSYQELTFTTALSVTNSATPYYFVINCGSNGGSPGFTSVQHYLRCTRIA